MENRRNRLPVPDFAVAHRSHSLFEFHFHNLDHFVLFVRNLGAGQIVGLVEPDDFIGEVPEALRLLADAFEKGFEKTHCQKRRGRPSKLSQTYDLYRGERLAKFWIAVSEGAKIDGQLILMEGDEKELSAVDRWD